MFANATVAAKWKSCLKAQKTIMQHKPSAPSVGAMAKINQSTAKNAAVNGGMTDISNIPTHTTYQTS